jgi:lysophospholipid acyltransferase (LPLAT)-like uncharacterized protein
VTEGVLTMTWDTLLHPTPFGHIKVVLDKVIVKFFKV